MTIKEFNQLTNKSDFKWTDELTKFFEDDKNLFIEYKELMEALDNAAKKAYNTIKNDNATTKDLFYAVQIIQFSNAQKEIIWKTWYSIPTIYNRKKAPN